MVVLSRVIRSNDRWMAASVSLSTDEVASSRYEDGRIVEHGAGDRDSLTLATGQLLASLSDNRLVSVR